MGRGDEHLGGEDEDDIYSGLNNYNAILDMDEYTHVEGRSWGGRVKHWEKKTTFTQFNNYNVTCMQM